jgi:membrane protease YdiL (CAAX protease family)
VKAQKPLPRFSKAKDFFVKGQRLHPLWLLLLYPMVLVLTGLVIVLPIYFILHTFIKPYIQRGQDPYSWINLAQQTIGVGMIISVFVVATWVWQRFLGKRTMSDLGLSFHRRWFAELGFGLLVGVGLTGSIFVAELIMGWIDIQGLGWHMQPQHDFLASLYLSSIGMIQVVVMEELLVRGYLLQTLEDWIGLPAAVIISSAIFGVAHVFNPTATGWANYVIPFALTLLGAMFGLAYLARRSLWLPIGLHFAWNLCEYYIFALTGPLPEQATVFITKIIGPAFWAGLPNSDFGPEVGMLGILAMSCGIGIFWYLIKKQSKSAPRLLHSSLPLNM